MLSSASFKTQIDLTSLKTPSSSPPGLALPHTLSTRCPSLCLPITQQTYVEGLWDAGDDSVLEQGLCPGGRKQTGGSTCSYRSTYAPLRVVKKSHTRRKGVTGEGFKERQFWVDSWQIEERLQGGRESESKRELKPRTLWSELWRFCIKQFVGSWSLQLGHQVRKFSILRMWNNSSSFGSYSGGWEAHTCQVPWRTHGLQPLSLLKYAAGSQCLLVASTGR